MRKRESAALNLLASRLLPDVILVVIGLGALGLLEIIAAQFFD